MSSRPPERLPVFLLSGEHHISFHDSSDGYAEETNEEEVAGIVGATDETYPVKKAGHNALFGEYLRRNRPVRECFPSPRASNSPLGIWHPGRLTRIKRRETAYGRFAHNLYVHCWE